MLCIEFGAAADNCTFDSFCLFIESLVVCTSIQLIVCEDTLHV